MYKDRKFLKGALVGAAVASVVFLGLFMIPAVRGIMAGAAVINSDYAVDGEFVEKFRYIQKCINDQYLDSDNIDKKSIQDGMYKGMLESIGDKYAAYYSEEEFADLMEKNMGKYGGIGAYVSQDPVKGDIVIVQPFAGGPADKAGIKAGDVITEIDGTSVIGMTLDEVVTIMKGEKNTTAVVKLLRGNETVEVEVVREEVDVPTVSHRIIEDGNIGYIHVSAFDDITVEQFRQAMDDIESRGASSLIIDVRDNGGGMLSTVIDMLDRVLPEGLVMYTETKDGTGEKYYSTNEESYDKPLVVMINGFSASASEVFAGAVQDFGAGTLIGTKSFGKGVVQTIMPVILNGEESAIKFTTARYYTPKGRNIDGIGITPDIEVEYDEESAEVQGDFVYDNQLREAVSYLKKQ